MFLTSYSIISTYRFPAHTVNAVVKVQIVSFFAPINTPV